MLPTCANPFLTQSRVLYYVAPRNAQTNSNEGRVGRKKKQELTLHGGREWPVSIQPNIAYYFKKAAEKD